MAPDTIAFIFARGGSKGVKRKNLRLLGGKPLIAHSIECAKATPGIGRVIVSTEDAEIAAAAKEWGAEIPFTRPAELAADDAPEILSWRHALTTLEQLEGRRPDIFVSVPATAPLRLPEDVKACLDLYQAGGCDIVVTMREAERSPYFNMVRIDSDGLARRVIEPDGHIGRRQDAPVVYDMTTVAYVASPDFVMRCNGVFDGRVKAVAVPRERAIDIDTEMDLQIAELLLSHRR